MILIKLKHTRIFYGLVALVFVIINYSNFSWNFFNSLGGLALAKSGPEITGIVFFFILLKIYWSEFYPGEKIIVYKKDFYAMLLILIITVIFHHKQFLTYFYKDDIYFWLNRDGIGYSVYSWEPWLSSHPGWVWELVRYLFGYSVFSYQIVAIASHILLGIGVYFLSKYLSKNYYVGLIAALFFSVTTISFEAFQWLSHPISFGWQGFMVCLSLITLIWEIEKNKATSVPYLSSFLIMSALGAGVARIGFILPLVSVTIFIVSVKYFKLKAKFLWFYNFVKNQWIFYVMAFAFYCVRSLWKVESTKTEVVTASLQKIYLYVVGIFSFPVELFAVLSKLTNSTISIGILTVFFGLMFQVIFFVAVLITKLQKKNFPLIVLVGFFWVFFSAVYFTLYGPHLPTTDLEIDMSARTHHLAYLSSIGPLMIWAYFIHQLIGFFGKLRKSYAIIASVLLLIGILTINYLWLSVQYKNFLELPDGVKITRQEFFFETYRKYIPDNAKKINVFYDNGYLSRRDNYKPLDGYYWGFWDRNKVAVIIGEDKLKKHLMNYSDEIVRKEEIESLYSIYTDYDNGLIEDNLSQELKDSLYYPESKNIKIEDWVAVWGDRFGNVFTPNIHINNTENLNFFENPVIAVNNLDFPAVLTPKMNIVLNVTRGDNNQRIFQDLRAVILSELLSGKKLPDSISLLSSLKNESDFLNIVNTPSVLDKMICEKTPKEGGVTFFISWVGEPDSYYLKLSNEDKNNIFSHKYNQRFYSICYFSQTIGVKNMSLDLSNTGSVVRGLVIVPLTKEPISLQLLESSLKSPQILK